MADQPHRPAPPAYRARHTVASLRALLEGRNDLTGSLRLITRVPTELQTKNIICGFLLLKKRKASSATETVMKQEHSRVAHLGFDFFIFNILAAILLTKLENFAKNTFHLKVLT